MTRAKKPRLAGRILLLLLPTVLLIAAVLALMSSRFSARVSLTLTASRIVFVVGGIEPVGLVTSVPVESVTLERFARVTLRPDRLEVSDPPRRSTPAGPLAAAAWKPVEIASAVVVEGEDETLQPALTFESTSTDRNADPAFGPLRVRPTAKVVIEVRDLPGGQPTIQVTGQPSSAVISFPGPFQLVARYARLSGITGRLPSGDLLVYRGRLSAAHPFVEVDGQPGAFVASLTLRPDTAADLFSRSGVPVTSVSLTKQGPTGAAETSLTGDGEIGYPDHPAMAAVHVGATEAVVLDALDRFRLEEISRAPEGKGLRLRLGGVAGRVTTGSPDFPRDRRLTRFDALWQNPGLAAIFGIAVWAFSTTLGAYQLYRELRSR